MMRDIAIGTVKVFTFLTKEANSRERITRVPDELAQIFFNHDKEKCLGNSARRVCPTYQ